MTRACSVCEKPHGIANRSGLCLKHFNARLNSDPDMHAKRVAGVRRDAVERRDEKRRVLLANAAKAMTPERREALRERMKRVQPLSQAPEVLAKIDMAAKGRKRTDTVLGWCPPEYRDEYRALVRSRSFNAAEAKAAILDQIRKDRAAADPLAQLSPFERQLALVASGKARVVDVVRIPSRGFERSLTGNAAAMVVCS